jgi:Protein of unknown function (DUF1501)
MNMIPHYEQLTNRRDLLRKGGAGFGAIALAAMMQDKGLLAALGDEGGTPGTPLTKQIPHTPGRAKNVIFLFMEGGPSHLDICDRKPLINELAGQPLPESFTKDLITAMGESRSPLLVSKREWKRYGQSGLEFSNWIPNIAELADDLCVMRSCVSDGINHSGGVCQMNTGALFGGRPSLGAWVSYGLGSENKNLPSFVVMKDSDTQPVNGVRNWGCGFMPAAYQGVLLDDGPQPFANLYTPKDISPARQQSKLAFLDKLNREHMKSRSDNTELDARLKSFELAFRMQATAPEVVDLSKETEATKALYGMDRPETQTFGRMCLHARRMVERGVRFVQLYSGSGSKWDAHAKIESNHTKYCGEIDKPVAGLIQDLKQRGLLEDTLVIWGGEFGRTPMSEKGDGRDHNPTGFSMIMAGGGVKGGTVIGETDEFGLRAVKDKVHVHDLHATIMYLLGVDHTKLLFHHKGRPERVDLNEGHPFKGIMG